MATPIPPNRARFTRAEIAEATGGTTTAPDAELVGITTDSRVVDPGSVFVALRGEVHDGHAFVATAAARGAALAVVARGTSVPAGLAVVEVDDTLVAWGALARRHLAKWRAAGADRRVVVITGSAGKTTTKELTGALLGAVGATHFTAGNLNNRIGVPAVVFALEEQRFCVLEMGMSLRGELDAMTSFARPDVAVVVNVGVAHAEGVGGREGVMHEKGAVYRALSPGGVAIVNADDPFVVRAAEEAGVRNVVTFGRRGANVTLGERHQSGTASRVAITAFGRELSLTVPLPGEGVAIDLCAALAAQETASGVSLDAAAIDAALAEVRIAGRGGTVHLAGDVLLLDDTYNANPASMRVALATLAEIGKFRRRVAVLGEMRELGALAEAEHTALGDAIAEAGVGLVIGCGGLVDLALDRAGARGVEIVRAASTAEAAREASERVRAGDAVLVKGSRGVEAEKVVAALVVRA